MREQLINRLTKKTMLMERFISEVLMSRNDVNKSKLNEFKTVLHEYKAEKEPEILYKLFEIESRPDMEGAPADYTTGMPLPIDEEYTSLMKLINDIQDLITKIRESD